jgi:excisionase family DNA binding protein
MTDRTPKPPRQKGTLKPASHMRVPNTRSQPVGDLHTIDELAERWEVSTRTVQRLIKSGALRIHRIGRLVRISEADIEEFLAKKRSY